MLIWHHPSRGKGGSICLTLLEDIFGVKFSWWWRIWSIQFRICWTIRWSIVRCQEYRPLQCCNLLYCILQGSALLRVLQQSWHPCQYHLCCTEISLPQFCLVEINITNKSKPMDLIIYCSKYIIWQDINFILTNSNIGEFMQHNQLHLFKGTPLAKSNKFFPKSWPQIL